jgi:hypothetical protein
MERRLEVRQLASTLVLGDNCHLQPVGQTPTPFLWACPKGVTASRATTHQRHSRSEGLAAPTRGKYQSERS